MERKEMFTYHFSSSEQEEVKSIREKYEKREESKLERLRRLDASVTRPGSIAAVTLGIAGALILGLGMCFCMVWEMLLPGCLIGIIGILCICFAYPLYQKITRKQREKLAPEIIRLTDELMK